MTLPMIHVYRTDYGDVRLSEREATLLRLRDNARAMGRAPARLEMLADGIEHQAHRTAKWRWEMGR